MQLENDNMHILDEVYFGRTPEIEQMHNQLRLVREKYRNINADPTMDKELIKFNRMVEDFFGFGCFSLTITLDPMPSIMTIPMDFNIDAVRKSNNFIVNDKTYKFRKEFDYSCVVIMTTGLFNNPQYRTGEVFAAILREIGHNFYSCMEKHNGILSYVYSAANIADFVADTVITFKSTKMFTDALSKSTLDSMAKSRVKMIDSNPKFKNLSKEVPKQLSNTVAKTINTAGKGYATYDTITKVYTETIGYRKSVDALKKEYKTNASVRGVLYTWMDYVRLGMKYISKGLNFAATIFTKMYMHTAPMNISNFIKYAGTEVLFPLETFKMVTLQNPMTYIMLPLDYKLSRGVDNFVTIYGYSAELTSLNAKMSSNKNNKITREILKKTPILGICYDIISTPAKIINGVFDATPDGISSCYDQINMLEYELNKQNLDPKMKANIKADIDACKKQLKKLTDISKGIDDPDLCKHLYNKMLSDVSSGVGLKELLLDSNSKFKNYDDQYDSKLHQGVKESMYDEINDQWWLETAPVGEELDALSEGKLQDLKDKADTEKELKAQWDKVAKSFVKHRWIFRYINEQQREMLDKYWDKLTSEETTYGEYTKAFKFICRFMGLDSKQVILEHMVFKHDDKDKNQPIIAVNYSKGLAKVTLPEHIRLVHISPADNITELNPSFRSKVKGKYMYPTKRVFFTIKKDIKPTKAGLQGMRTHRYTPKQPIRTAYIDPTYADYGSGFVYVETNSPIPVEKWDRVMDKIYAKLDKITGNDPEKQNEKAAQNRKDNVKHEDASLYDDEYDIFDESVLSDFLAQAKQWKTSNQAHSKKVFKNNSLSTEEYEKLKDLIDVLKNEESYEVYKKAFNKFCSFCHIVPRGTIITKYDLKKGSGDDNNSIYVEYSENTKKIDIPQGLKLFHLSSVKDIKELKPFFRGKSSSKNSGGYLYDKPRIYLTVKEHMPKFLADYKATESMHKYQVKGSIKSAYVDPLVWNNIQGAVYIETNKTVPVEEVGKKDPNAKPEMIENLTDKGKDQSKFKDTEMSDRTKHRIGYSMTTQGHDRDRDLDKSVKESFSLYEFAMEYGLQLEYYTEDDGSEDYSYLLI